MEAKDIIKLITEYGLTRNVSYDPKYFTHNMPEFSKIAEISFKAGEEKVVDWVERTSKTGYPSYFIPGSEWQAFKEKEGL